MRNKKLKMLLAAMTGVFGIGMINSFGDFEVLGDYTIHEVYAAETQGTSRQINADISYEAEAEKDSINPIIVIKNTDSTALDLKTLNLQYYYPSDLDSEEVYNCYYAGTEDGEDNNFTNYVNAEIKKDYDTDNAFADINFSGGTLNAGQSMIIKGGIHKADWSFYNVDDKSLCSLKGYINGNLVYGEEPEVVFPELEEESRTSGKLKIKVNLNGNKFLGIKGLSEGKNYSFDGTNLEISYRNYESTDKDFYLMFSNNIRKVITINGNSNGNVAYIPEDIYVSKISGGTFERGDVADILVGIYNNTTPYKQDMDEFNLKYDPEYFEVLGMSSGYEEVKYEDDPSSGIIHVDSREYLEGSNKGFVDLFLKVKDNAPLGSTKINFAGYGTKFGNIPIVNGQRQEINITK